VVSAASVTLALLFAQAGRAPATVPPATVAPAIVPPAIVPPAAEAPAASGVQVSLLEPEQSLVELVDAAAQILGIAIEYTAADLPGNVTLRLPGPIARAELLDTMHRALSSRGLTTIQAPGSESLSVVKLTDALALARLEESGSARAGFRKVLIELSHERVDAAAEAVKLVLSKSGSVTPFKEARRLVVADLAPHVAQARRIAAEIDRSLDERAVVEIPLARTSPTSLAALVDRIANAEKAAFGDRGRGVVLAHPEGRSILVVAPVLELDRWRGLVEQFDRAEPALTQNYSPRRFALSDLARLVEEAVHGSVAQDANEPWRVVVDALSGTLIITATPARHAEIERLLERLERLAPTVQRPLRSFPVRHRSAGELRDLLQSLLDAGALVAAAQAEANAVEATPNAKRPTTPLTAQGPTGPLTKQPKARLPPLMGGELGDDVVITVDEPTNRLLVLASPRVHEQIEDLLATLDVRTPQVLVEAIVVNLTGSQRFELGVEITKLKIDGDVQARLSSVFGLGVPDPSAGTLPPLGMASGATGVVLSPGDFSALVRALQTVDNGRTLTHPRILVDNNRQATLNSVLQTPYAATNASSTVATTSFGGTQDAGTQIDITPQIMQGDQLMLDYTVSISTFVGEAADPALPPPRQETRLKSIATIPDGFVVSVGGLGIQNEGEGRSKIPLLGDIPLLGELFGTRERTSSEARFYVFLRASVMRSATFEDLKYASGRDLAAASVDDGFPRLAPRIMR